MSDSLAARAKRCIAIFYAVCASLLFLQVTWVALSVGINIWHVVMGLLLVALTIGLVMNKSFALKTTGVLCLLFAIIIPVLVFDLTAIGDYMVAGKEPPSFPGSLIWLIPLDIFLLFSAHVLDPRFRKSGKAVNES